MVKFILASHWLFYRMKSFLEPLFSVSHPYQRHSWYFPSLKQKIPNDHKQYYPYCRLNLLVKNLGHCKFEPTNHDLIKVPQVLKFKVSMGPTVKLTLIDLALDE